jgi:hypothetical protein
MSQFEKREFKMSPHLLWDVITRQAGRIEKAVLEAVMNSIDAGSTRCDVTITPQKIEISDDGKGFVDKMEIENFFATFGYRHQEGDARYGRFRMGRGQMFSFGVNDWTSGEFRMRVDLKPQKDQEKLGFDYSESNPRHKGCRIEIALYERLMPSDVQRISMELKNYVAWAEIPVVVNGTQVNKLPSQGKWDEEDADAYYKFSDRGSLDVYNIGVLVRSYPASDFGSGGIIVSKAAVGVNFARNDIQSDCPIWRRITKKVRAQQTDAALKKPRLDETQREALAQNLFVGNTGVAAALDAQLLTDVKGNAHALKKLGDLTRYGGQVTVAPRRDRLGEAVMQKNLAFVLDEQTVERFGADSLKELLDGLAGMAEQEYKSKIEERHGKHPHTYWNLPDSRQLSVMRDLGSAIRHLKLVDIQSLKALVSTDYKVLAPKDLKPSEKLVLDALKLCSNHVVSGIYVAREEGNASFFDDRNMGYGAGRRIALGESDSADGWTDGQSNIWINREFVARNATKGFDGWVRIAGLILHEYMHQGPDTDTHVHDAAFYQAFHDMTIDTGILGKAAQVGLTKFADDLAKAQKKMAGKMTDSLDTGFKATQMLGVPSGEALVEQTAVQDEGVPASGP